MREKRFLPCLAIIGILAFGNPQYSSVYGDELPSIHVVVWDELGGVLHSGTVFLTHRDR